MNLVRDLRHLHDTLSLTGQDHSAVLLDAANRMEELERMIHDYVDPYDVILEDWPLFEQCGGLDVNVP